VSYRLEKEYNALKTKEQEEQIELRVRCDVHYLPFIELCCFMYWLVVKNYPCEFLKSMYACLSKAEKGFYEF